VSSQRDSEQADIAKETWELTHTPEIELDELTAIYASKGLNDQLAREVAVALTKKDALKVHMAEELGITEMTMARPLQAGVSSAGAFSVGAAIPLISVALAASAHRIVTTIVVAIFALIALGVSSSKAGGANPLRPTFRVVFGGLVAMAFTIAVGRFVGAAVA
jgi:VIT1/CCC1 family predicted Fe2+/Mn2+ transporter